MTLIEIAISNIISTLAKTNLNLKNKVKSTKDLSFELEQNTQEKEKFVLSKFQKSAKEKTEEKITKFNKDTLDLAEKTLRAIIKQNNPSSSLSLNDLKKNKRKKGKK